MNARSEVSLISFAFLKFLSYITFSELTVTEVTAKFEVDNFTAKQPVMSSIVYILVNPKSGGNKGIKQKLRPNSSCFILRLRFTSNFFCTTSISHMG